MSKYFVYVDQTSDGIAYYVGYGNEERVNCFKRNKKHSWVSRHHGLERTIVHETDDVNEAKSIEIFWIEQCATFVKHPFADEFACNFTLGGDGVNGGPLSVEHRQAISQSKRGKKKSFETRLKMSEANRRRVHSSETKLKIGDSRRGKLHSDETKKQMSESRQRFLARKNASC